MNRAELPNPGDYFRVLDAVREAAGTLLGLSGVMRFKGTPFMNEAFAAGYINPVGSHTAECCQLWSMLREVMPNLAEAVDNTAIYDILANHDNGELKKGDITLYDKANGAFDDKAQEIEDAIQLYRHLPEPLRSKLVRYAHDFEADEEQDVSLEIRVARLIDSLQGNIVVLEKGQDLPVLASNTVEMLRMRVIPRAKILICILESRGDSEAADEVRALALHHLLDYRSKGVDIELQELKIAK